MPAATIERLAVEFATPEAGGAPLRLRARAAPSTASSSTAPPTRLAAMTGNVGIPGGNSGTSNGATGRCGIRVLPAGTNPTGARVALVDAGRPPRPRPRRRLSGRHQDGLPAAGDLFNQAPNVGRIVAAAQRLEFMVVHDNFSHPDRALRGHRASGDDLLGAQRRPHALGGRGPLRDLHEAGDRTSRRVPERPRHLRRPGAPPRDRGLQRPEPRGSGCAS